MTALLPWLPLPLVGLAAGLFVYARRYLQSCRGEWGNGRLRLCRGVWFRREWVIAQSAVRELDVFAPPAALLPDVLPALRRGQRVDSADRQ